MNSFSTDQTASLGQVSPERTTMNETSTSSLQTTRGVQPSGYRRWNGLLQSGWTRWSVVAEVGIRRAWQSQWLKRMLFFAWLPAFWFGIAFFLWEQASQYSDWLELVSPLLLRNLPADPMFDDVRESIVNGRPSDSRHTVWAYLLLSFFRYPQAVVMVLIIGMIAPPLISQDIRSRAFLLYFSRPLTRFEYILGKVATLCAYLGMISAVPAIVLYLLGVVLSPSLSVMTATWDLPLRILAASAVLMIPTSALALCLSSITQESRYAGFAWFAIWILGWFTYMAAQSAEAFKAAQQTGFQEAQQPRIQNPGRNRFRGPPGFRQRPVIQIKESVWTRLSLYHTLGRVQSWVFGFEKLSDIIPSLLILAGISAGSLFVLFHRISAPMRV